MWASYWVILGEKNVSIRCYSLNTWVTKITKIRIEFRCADFLPATL